MEISHPFPAQAGPSAAFAPLWALCRRADPRSLPTANAAWATMVVDELARCGVDRFVVSPGSRSTPLALAIARDPATAGKLAVVHDERSAAFYALGHARARPGSVAAVLTTSGTAVANLLPAACEADAAGVPLLLLTADRPAALKGVGADQALESQGRVLEPVCRRVADLPPPDDRVAGLGDLAEVAAAVRAATRADAPGPAQLNLAFAENLAPRRGAVRGGASGARGFPAGSGAATSDWDPGCLAGATASRWLAATAPLVAYDDQSAAAVAPGLGHVLLSSSSGVVVLGEIDGADRLDAAHLLRALGWPVVHADARSGLRGAARDLGLLVERPNVVLSDAAGVAASLAPDCVLQLGGAPVYGGAGQGCEIPNFGGSYLGRFPLVSADFWTSDHLSERSRSVDAFLECARAERSR